MRTAAGMRAAARRQKNLFAAALGVLLAVVPASAAVYEDPSGDAPPEIRPFPRDIQILVEDLVSSRRYEEALDLALPALRETPADVTLLAQSARCFAVLGREAEGIAFLASVLDSTLYPDHLLFAEGNMLALGNDLERGVELLETAAGGFRERGDEAALLVVLSELGQYLNRLRRYDESKLRLGEALDLGTPGGLMHHRINALNHLGVALNRTGAVDSGSVIQQEALDLARITGSPLESRQCNNLAWIRQLQGRLAEAKDLYLRAAEMAGARGDDWARMQRLRRAASVSIRLGDLTEAHAHLDTCLALSALFPDRPGQRADILVTVGRALRMEGDHPRALAALEEAVAILDTSRVNPEHTFTALQQIANVLADMGRLHEALGYHERAGELVGGLSPTMLAGLHNNVGNCLVNLGDPPGALEKYRESLRISEEYDLATRRPTYHANIASVLTKLGRYEAAVEMFERAQAGFTGTGDVVNSIHVQIDLAVVHTRLGNLDQAEELLLAARARMQSEGTRYRLAGCLTALAGIDRARGDLDSAREHLREALDQAEAAETEAEAMAARLSLTQLERRAGNLDAAAAQAEEGLNLARERGFVREEAQFLVELGALARIRGNPENAEPDLTEALEVAHRIRAPVVTFGAAVELGRSLREMGRAGSASAAYRRAIEAAEVLRRGVGAETERWSVFSGVAHAYVELALLLVETGGADAASEAFLLVEQARARTLLDRLVAQGVNLDQGIPTDLVAEREQILNEYGYVHSRLQEALSSHPGRVDSLAGVLDVLDRDYARVEGRIRQNREDSGHLDLFPRDDAGNLREFLDEGTALVEFTALEDGGVLVFHASATSPVQAFLAPGVGPTAERLRTLAGESSPRSFDAAAFAEAATTLYTALLKPVLAAHRPRHLVVVADGPLADLPLECLLTEPAADRGLSELPYLFRTCAITYAPSAAALVQLKNRRPSEPGSLKRALVLADPEYGSAATSGERGLTPESAARRSADRFGALPHSRREAEAVQNALGADSVRLRLGREATEEAFKAEAAEGWDCLHLAAHSYVDEDFPLISAVVLSRDGSSPEDGFLTIREIYTIRLSTELVVLSSCGTAAGRRIRGEGVIALARPFLAAGARAAVVTSWSVNDRSTAEFMTAFYGELAVGAPVTVALTAAREHLLASGRSAWTLPYHWAPFTLIGDLR